VDTEKFEDGTGEPLHVRGGARHELIEAGQLPPVEKGLQIGTSDAFRIRCPDDTASPGKRFVHACFTIRIVMGHLSPCVFKFITEK
jgi:hypothetical protein